MTAPVEVGQDHRPGHRQDHPDRARHLPEQRRRARARARARAAARRRRLHVAGAEAEAAAEAAAREARGVARDDRAREQEGARAVGRDRAARVEREVVLEHGALERRRAREVEVDRAALAAALSLAAVAACSPARPPRFSCSDAVGGERHAKAPSSASTLPSSTGLPWAKTVSPPSSTSERYLKKV